MPNDSLTNGAQNTDAATQQTASAGAPTGAQANATTQQSTADTAADKLYDNGQKAAPVGDEGKTAVKEPEGDKKPEGDDAAKKPDADKDAKPGVPEKYEDFQAPEGVSFDEELMGEFTTVAKESGASQETAQKYVNLAVKMNQKFGEQMMAKRAEANETWKSESKADKEFGGDKLDANLAIAKRAIEVHASEKLRQLLGEFDPVKNPTGTNLGNNPEIIRLFYRVGKTISEDTVVTGSAGNDTPKDPAKVLFPNMN